MMENEEKGSKRAAEDDDSNLYEQWKKLVREFPLHKNDDCCVFQRPQKRQCRIHVEDLISTMEKDKHLKRSTLFYKALEKSSF